MNILTSIFTLNECLNEDTRIGFFCPVWVRKAHIKLQKLEVVHNSHNTHASVVVIYTFYDQLLDAGTNQHFFNIWKVGEWHMDKRTEQMKKYIMYIY